MLRAHERPDDQILFTAQSKRPSTQSMPFSDLGLSDDVVRAVADAGYSKPTPIQEQAIPIVLMGRDVLGCAQTGTGKTASFTLPMLDILSSGQAKARMPRSLILEPTRELATQVAENFDVYGKYGKLSKALLIGGVSFDEQNKLLDRGVDVLIATPGRLLDHVERGRVMLRGVTLLVIDEADRMLDMGFIPDVERIVGLLPPIRQTLFFSATMPPEIRRLADAFLMNPKEITVSPPTSVAETVVQALTIVDAADKRETLRRLIRSQNVKNALIFCNRKRDVDILARSLDKHGFNARAMHGDMSQPERTETMDLFKAGGSTLLVASDVAARGLDIQGLSHVFNFDVPMHSEDYIHRIGRTGRAGLPGKAFTIAAPEDGKFVEAIQSMTGVQIPVIEVEGVEGADLDASDRRRGRGGRKRAAPSGDGPKRERGRRKSAKPKREPDKADERKPAPSEAREPAESAETKPKTERAPAKKTAARPKAKREAKAPVVGMGEHMPDFMKRPARNRRRDKD
jgi:superfamily II DNA/RNA helicase